MHFPLPVAESGASRPGAHVRPSSPAHRILTAQRAPPALPVGIARIRLTGALFDITAPAVSLVRGSYWGRFPGLLCRLPIPRQRSQLLDWSNCLWKALCTLVFPRRAGCTPGAFGATGACGIPWSPRQPGVSEHSEPGPQRRDVGAGRKGAVSGQPGLGRGARLKGSSASAPLVPRRASPSVDTATLRLWRAVLLEGF